MILTSSHISPLDFPTHSCCLTVLALPSAVNVNGEGMLSGETGFLPLNYRQVANGRLYK